MSLVAAVVLVALARSTTAQQGEVSVGAERPVANQHVAGLQGGVRRGRVVQVVRPQRGGQRPYEIPGARLEHRQ